jgi:hypothetical protein
MIADALGLGIEDERDRARSGLRTHSPAWAGVPERATRIELA